MSIFQSIILGALQGVTEFFPVSSSAHLILLPYLLDWLSHSLVFDTTLHIGTALAVIIYFYKDFLKIIKSFLFDFSNRKKFVDYSSDSKMGIFIFIGIIPAGIIGFLFEYYFETLFRGVLFTVLFLILGSLLMLYAEYRLNRVPRSDLTVKKSLKIGFFQVLALFPGFSRSGSTISGGMLLGLTREESTRFSFLMSVPIILFAGVFKLISSFSEIQTVSTFSFIAGFLASFLMALLSVSFLMKYLKNNNLKPFILYRLILAVFITFVTLI